MTRLLLVMALGAAGGAGLVWWAIGDGSDRGGDAVSAAATANERSIAGGDASRRADSANQVSAVTLAPGDSLEAMTPNPPPGDQIGTWIDGYVALAKRDLDAAIRSALTIEDFWAQRSVMHRLGAEAAAQNPEAGIALSAEFADFRLINQFGMAFFESWGEIDPEAAFAYFETTNLGLIPLYDQTFAGLAASDPERLLAIASDFPPNSKRVAQRAAFAALASQDPYSALTVLNSFASGTSWASADRAAHVRTIAQSIAYTDPTAALNLVHSLPPADRAEIVAGVANADVLAAADFVLADIASTPETVATAVTSLQQIMNRAFQADSDTAATVIDKLAAIDNPAATQALGNFVSQWAAFDATRAMDWALSHPANVPDASMENLAVRLGRGHPDLASEAIARVPLALRDTWVRNAATGMARNNFNGALNLLSQIGSRAQHDQAVDDLLRQTLGFGTQTGPGQATAIINYLNSAQPDVRARHAAGAAGALAAEDPAAAANWIAGLGLASEDGYIDAVQNVASLWSRSDAAAATNWALNLPPGEPRDRALQSFLTSVPLDTRVADRVFNGFTSSGARDAAVSQYVLNLGRFDPERGGQLIELYISDPQLRRRTAERMNQSQILGTTSLLRRP